MAETNGKAVLFGKMAKVLGAVNRIPKNGRNTFHNYDYVTESDLVEELRRLMASNGIAFFVSVDGAPERIDMGDSRNGPLTRVKMLAHFCCSETGETFSISFYGDGQDKGDKGIYKAYTGAVKYMLMKTFLVSTGDDPEVDDQPAPTMRNTPKAEPPPFDRGKAIAALEKLPAVTESELKQARTISDRAKFTELYDSVKSRAA